ncbi:MAG: pyrroloquinoline quinone biosynthesis peptide chaperone PqqD [Polyangiales bacterium]
MIDGTARPKLAPKVRLRFDRHSGQHWLMYPERGMSLNVSAARIAALCTGEQTVDAIIDLLHAEAAGCERVQVAADVRHFLEALLERSLVRLA